VRGAARSRGLQDEDVDGTRVSIRRQRLVLPTRTWDEDRVYTRETTKNRRERVVLVSEDMAAVLRRWKVTRGEEKLAWGPGYVEGWVCAEPDGSPIQPDTLSRRFRALEKKAGVPHRGLHACRRTHAEIALSNGSRLEVVSKRLSHSSISITADIYGHPDEAAMAEVAEGVARTIEGR
jgi:integrase